MRRAVAALIAPFMRLTGFRFTKDYRWGVTPWHRNVYRVVDVVQANLWAERL